MLDGSAQGTGKCVMMYKLYNEGWILDEVIMENPIHFLPLKEPDFTDADIFEAVKSFYLDRNLSNLSIYAQNISLDQKMASYSISAVDAHKYMTETLDIVCDCFFDEYGCGKWIIGDCHVSNKKENWNICGDYTCISMSKGAAASTIKITDVDVDLERVKIN